MYFGYNQVFVLKLVFKYTIMQVFRNRQGQD